MRYWKLLIVLLAMLLLAALPVQAQGEPGDFLLVSPPNNITITDLSIVTEITWTPSAGADSYIFGLDREDLTKHVLNLQLDAADICTDTLCTIPVDDATRALLEDGQYAWRVRGVNEAGETYAANRPFRFTVANAQPPLPFSLVAPADGVVVTDPNDVTVITWRISPGAATYNFVLNRTDIVDEVLNVTLNAADICSGPLCIIPVTDDIRALLADGDYSWTVTATNDNGTTPASNNPFTFVVNVAGLPLDFDLLTPPDGAVVTDTSVVTEISWTVSAGADEYTFNLQRTSGDPVGEVLDITLAAGDICGADTCVIPVSDEVRALLTDGDYSWTVVAANANGETPASNNPFTFTVDAVGDAPGEFDLLTPPNGAVVTDTSVVTEISWTVSAGADEYTFNLQRTAGDPVGEVLDITLAAGDICGEDTCVISVSDEVRALLTDGDYSWTVVAANANGETPASNNPFTFTVDAVGDAPGEFDLLTPPDGAVVTDTSVVTEISWTVSAGADEYTFNLQRTSGDPVGEVLDITLAAGDICGADTCVIPVSDEVRALLTDGDYSWTVVAANANGETPASNNPFTFTVDAVGDAPGEFDLLTPPDGAVVTDTSVVTEISWTVSAGADEYTFNLQRTAGDPVGEVLDITLAAGDICGEDTCVIPVSDEVRALLTDGDYSWTVVAANANGETPASNNPFTFTVDAVGDAPGEFDLLTPPNGAVVTDTSVVTEISWTVSAGADEYTFNLQRTAGDPVGEVLDITLAAGDICGADTCVIPVSDEVRALLTDGDYSWTVVAANANGETPASNNPFTFTVAISGTITEAPVNVQVTGNLTSGEARPTISWQPAMSENNTPMIAAWYNVVLTDQNNNAIFDQWYSAWQVCTSTGCAVTPDQSVMPFGLMNGSYNAWTRSWQNDTFSAWSQGAAFTVNVPIPQVNNLSTNGPTISWAADPNLLWFELYVGSAGTAALQSWYPITSALCENGTCTYTPTGVPGGSYDVYMRGWGAADVSAWAGPVSITLEGNATGMAANLAVDGNTFTWTAGENATYYQMWIGTSPELNTAYLSWFGAAAIGCETGTCTVTDVPLAAGEYIWYVIAWGPEGYSQGGLSGWAQGPVFTVE